MTTEWAHLPNAAHIDRVLADANHRPEVWVEIKELEREETWIHAWDAAWTIAWDATRILELAAARNAARSACDSTAWAPAWGASLALIAWDDSAELLALDPDAVRLLAASGHTPAILLLPACIALKTT